MVNELWPALGNMFRSIADWLTSIISAVDGYQAIMAGFMIVLVVSLLLLPLRGDSLTGLGFDFTINSINTRKWKAPKMVHRKALPGPRSLSSGYRKSLPSGRKR